MIVLYIIIIIIIVIYTTIEHWNSFTASYPTFEKHLVALINEV